MALIYRSIVEVESPSFVEGAHECFVGWLATKRLPSFDLAADGVVVKPDDGHEMRASRATEGNVDGYRAHLFETRQGEIIRTTFTAIDDTSTRWAWIDVERWAEEAFEPGWVPFAPRLVGDVLDGNDCKRSGMLMRREYVELGSSEVGDLVEQLVSSERDVPIVVVSPTKEEREGDIAPAQDRSEKMARRVAGVASVVLLGPGATSTLSKALFDALGDGFDVHSGAIRTYLPGLGEPGDRPRRHPWVPYSRLANRPPMVASELVAGVLLRGSTHLQPPTVWRDVLRPVLDGTGVLEDKDYPVLLDLAERERDVLALALDVRTEQHEDDLEALDTALRQVDRLDARVRRLEQQVRESGEALVVDDEPAEDFDPAFCEEVLEEARRTLPLVVLPDTVDAGVADLDQHMNQSWARKAWRALRAMQAYAEAKGAGQAQGMNLLSYCQAGDGPIVPEGWIALNESQTTDNNDRFRGLRTLPVDAQAHADGRVYMSAHIKIQKGGTPCPRIHFYDDTDGATGKIHVGWFGDHLDNKSGS